jgi:Trm5-related predicted tRNA methylase
MDKEKAIKKSKTAHPRKYPQEIVDKILSLIKQGKNLNEILQQVPCKKSAVRRYARKAGLTIKNKA